MIPNFGQKSLKKICEKSSGIREKLRKNYALPLGKILK